MDSRHRVIAYEPLFRGTVNGATVHPRVVLQRALEKNAAALIVAHNHPSGNTDPSASDIAITEKLVEALKLIDVRLLDHFVITAKSSTSFADRGLI